MIGNNVDGLGRLFEIVAPGSEGLVDSEQLLVVDIVVEFRTGERSGVKGERMDFVIRDLEKDSRESVVRGIRFDNEQGSRFPLRQRGSRSEHPFQGVKGFLILRSPLPRGILPSELSKWKDDVGVVGDETAVELANPRKDWTSFTLRGVGQSRMTLTLSSAIRRPKGERM